MPWKISARMLDEPLIKEACYLMRLSKVSLVPNEPSERPPSALRHLIKEPEQKPHSALRGLLDAIPEQPKPERHASALTGLLGSNN
ncbi:hypothetical protein N9513_08490 [Gammaproteobacteria bacterium]|nr:hypothetical protein [Gammaproteobacteria bacterium]